MFRNVANEHTLNKPLCESDALVFADMYNLFHLLMNVHDMSDVVHASTSSRRLAMLSGSGLLLLTPASRVSTAGR